MMAPFRFAPIIMMPCCCLLLLIAAMASVEAFAPPANNAFAVTSPSTRSAAPPIINHRPLVISLQNNENNDSSIRGAAISFSSSRLHMNKIDEDLETSSSSSTSPTFYTPFDRPLLAIIDTISLVAFAAIGKSSHSPDGALDVPSVLLTAFPFVVAWLAASPLTGVYSPDDGNNNLLSSTALKVGKGWILAVPLGIVGRGFIKGYVPPVPFIVVTLIATLVMVAGARVLFSLAEDFFVEFV